MEVRAVTKFARVSPRKARIIADQIRGKAIEDALNIVGFLPQRAASVVGKTLKSAVANAQKKEAVNVDTLYVERIFVDGGPMMKRFRARAMGRAAPIRKRMSHITIVLSDGVSEDALAEEKIEGQTV